LDAVARAGVAVLANRPLNAIVGGTMIRLADAEAPGDVVDIDARRRAVVARSAAATPRPRTG